jgi:hypothetical protein
MNTISIIQDPEPDVLENFEPQYIENASQYYCIVVHNRFPIYFVQLQSGEFYVRLGNESELSTLILSELINFIYDNI